MYSKNILYIGDPTSIHDFKWITFFSEKGDYNCYLIGEVNACVGITEKVKANLKGHKIKLLPAISDFSISKPIQTIKAILYLRKLINQYEIDTIHALFGSPQPIWFNFLSKKKKLIITTRGSDVLVLIKGLFELKKNFLGKLLYGLIKSGFKKSNYVTCTSTKQIEYLRKDVLNTNHNLSLIKTGVEVDVIKKHNEPCLIDLPLDKKVVFSIRFIGPVYNMDYQIEAIKELPLSLRKSLCFVFIKGNSVQESFFQDFLGKLEDIEGLDFKILDSISQLEIWSLIKRSDLVYMVPISDGTPNSALETMAARKPLIMGDLGYNNELFNRVSLIAKLGFPKSLASAIESGLNSYPEVLLDNGFNKVSKFGSRQSEMKKLLKIYQE